MQNATNCYGDTGRMTTKHDSLHRGHGIKCEDMGSKRNRITLRRLVSAFLPLLSDMLEELVLGFVSGKGLARERFDLVTYPLYLMSWRGYGVLSGGLESACMSAVFSKLQRILLLRSRVISLSYAGGDGGSSLFQYVGDTRKACKVVVYGSSAAARRPSSLWTSTALSLYGSSGWRQMSMRIGRLVLIERLLFGAWFQHLADSDISVPKVWRLSIWSLVVSTSPILASFGVGGNCTCRFLASYSDYRELATPEATQEVSAS
uniref:Uncharacterized protein n=1 Tax=Brassica oleracea var. oleracea TaxID=109376 RepID=A0A0D3DAZ7_BRAOL